MWQESARRRVVSRTFSTRAVGEREGREAAGGVAGVDAALLDVLEDRAHVALLGVAEGVDIELDGVLEEGVEVDGVVRGDLGGLGHVAHEVLVIVDDAHARPPST